MKKPVPTLLFAALLAGCIGQAVETTSTDNTNFNVDTLFNKDGCTVYRFYDGLHARYFVRCEGGQSRVEWTEGCGKNCTRPVAVPTARQLL